MSKSNGNSYFSESFTEHNIGLGAYFGRLVKGQPEVYTTTFAQGESTEQLLGAWKEVLKSIGKEWPSLWDFEIDLASKVGPMSVMKPLAERMGDIDAYYDGILLPSAPIKSRALEAVLSEFGLIRGLMARDQHLVWVNMRKDTNSGSPFFKKRRDVFCIPCWASIDGDGVEQNLYVPNEYREGTNPTRSWKAAAVLGWRGQEGGADEADVKQRVIWMFPLAVNVCELQVYQPLIEAAQKFDLVPAWVSLESVDRRITSMFDTKGADDLVVCTDFSKFDQHFNSHMQDAAQSILHGILTPGKHDAWFEDIFPIKYMIPLAFNMGDVRFGKHGMGSGSGGTNCDETLAHRALQYESAILHDTRLNPNSQCLGDDGVITYPGITVEDVVKAYTSHGLEMNLDKQYASRVDCTYLRRWHHAAYRIGGVCAGVYSTCRALGRLRYLERFQDPEIWTDENKVLRSLSILENCKHHPLREQFVDFCLKRDEFQLGLGIPGFFDRLHDIAKKAGALGHDILGYTRAHMSERPGIANWWIVQYLSSK